MSDLKTRASEVLARWGGRPLRPRLLAGGSQAALILTLEGLREKAWDELPADLDLSGLVDHTLLRPEATKQDVDRLCGEALEQGFASVCVNPWWVAEASARLAGSGVRTCTVVGFPLGATLTSAKAFEAEAALRAGAEEVDMVLAVGALKSGARGGGNGVGGGGP